MERTKKPQEPTIIAFDPSFTGWGYVVMSKAGDICVTGCIKTEPLAKKLKIRKGDDTNRRINQLNGELLSVMKQWNVCAIISEQPHGSQNATAAKMIGIVLGMIQTYSDVFELPIEWYSEGDCKKATLNKRAATKEETVQKMINLYNIEVSQEPKYRKEAICDALQVYHTAKLTGTLIKMMQL
jgi:Holliday junction resolvasome RuvABC endonuclease subunit